MDAKRLASLLRGGPGGPLVIDSRSFVEYNRSHVLSSVNICCSKLVKRRLQQGKVTISELIQPAVRSQVPCARRAPRPASLGQGRAPGPGARGPLAWATSLSSALEPKPGSPGQHVLGHSTPPASSPLLPPEASLSGLQECPPWGGSHDTPAPRHHPSPSHPASGSPRHCLSPHSARHRGLPHTGQRPERALSG